MNTKKILPVIAASIMAISLVGCSSNVIEEKKEASKPTEAAAIPVFDLTKTEDLLINSGYLTMNADNMMSASLGTCNINISQGFYAPDGLDTQKDQTPVERLSQLHVMGAVEVVNGTQLSDANEIVLERPNGEEINYTIVDFSFEKESVPHIGVNASHIPEGTFSNPYAMNEKSIVLMQVDYSCADGDYNRGLFDSVLESLDIIEVERLFDEAPESEEVVPEESTVIETETVEDVENNNEVEETQEGSVEQ